MYKEIFKAPCNVLPLDTLKMEVDTSDGEIVIDNRDRRGVGRSIHLKADNAIALAKAILAQAEVNFFATKQPIAVNAVPKAPRYANLSPLCAVIYQHMNRAGSISARDAFNDHGITSASLSRRICDIEAEGFAVNRDSKTHPVTERRYTRYSLAA